MSIQYELNQIKSAVYGADVRGAIHDGVEKGYNKASQAESNSLDIKQTYDEILMQWESDSNKDPEVITARGGLPQLEDRFTHMEIKVFNEVPSTSQLKEGEFGFVIDTAQQQYDELNLSFESLNHLGFPTAFSTSPTGGGVKIVEANLSEIRSTDGTYRSAKVGQIGGVDGSSSYARLRTANIIPVDGSKKIVKSDLTNFRFSVKPLSANCHDGSGLHMGSASVSFRGGNNEVLGAEASNHFIYDAFPIPPNATGNKVVLDEWTVVKWDLQEACRKMGINFDLVAGVIVTFNAYTNHSTASCEYLVDDISFGV